MKMSVTQFVERVKELRKRGWMDDWDGWSWEGKLQRNEGKPKA